MFQTGLASKICFACGAKKNKMTFECSCIFQYSDYELIDFAEVYLNKKTKVIRKHQLFI